MIFKKKYKKSEWMEGLLWAEKTLTHYYDCLLYTSPSPRD